MHRCDNSYKDGPEHLSSLLAGIVGELPLSLPQLALAVQSGFDIQDLLSVSGYRLLPLWRRRAFSGNLYAVGMPRTKT